MPPASGQSGPGPEHRLLRILLLNQTFHPDVAATAQHAHDLGRYLVERGHEVVVVSSRSIYGSRGAVLPAREVVDGIEVHRVGFSLFGKGSILGRLADFVIFYLAAALRVLTLRRPDVLIGFTTPPFIALVGWLSRLLRGGRFVYWVMDLYPDVLVACGVMKPASPITRILDRINRFCLRRADRSVVLGQCMLQRVLDKGVDADRLAVINVWSDDSELAAGADEAASLRREWGLADRFVVMYSGNLGLGHDVETLRGAMEALRDDERIAFVFVGGGKRMDEARKFAEDRGLAHVRFQPYQPRERLGAVLALADVHLISLLDASLGVMVPSKLYGIMAAGRAAVYVGPAESEVGRTLDQHEAGVRIASGDADGLAAALRKLAENPDRAREMGTRARAALCAHYDRPHACLAWESLLQSLHTEADGAAAGASRSEAQ
ncbi:MAG: glycosyltransferase family 4 protein [Phycisphaeraceae bacterium]|nr:glycosyltransferase family 4 protein [Phycisphaeraceae bacterium]